MGSEKSAAELSRAEFLRREIDRAERFQKKLESKMAATAAVANRRVIVAMQLELKQIEKTEGEHEGETPEQLIEGFRRDVRNLPDHIVEELGRIITEHLRGPGAELRVVE